MEHEKIIEKIKKCLALSNSDNPHEAAAALRQAQKLMQMHGLSELDVQLSDVQELKAKASTVDTVNWEVMLANLIADAFGCHILSSSENSLTQKLQLRRQRFYHFVGIAPAADIAQYAFEVLTEQCAKARRRHIAAQRKNCTTKTKTARGDAFAEGYIYGLQNLIQKFANPEGSKQLIEHYMNEKYPNLKQGNAKDRTKGKNISHNDYYAGKIEAKNAQLHQAVGGKKLQGLLS